MLNLLHMKVVGEYCILNISGFGTVVLFYLISFFFLFSFFFIFAVIGNSTEQNLVKLSYFSFY